MYWAADEESGGFNDTGTKNITNTIKKRNMLLLFVHSVTVCLPNAPKAPNVYTVDPVSSGHADTCVICINCYGCEI